LTVLAVSCLAATATTAAPRKGVGLRLGTGPEPDQFVVGLQSDCSSLGRFIRFVSSANLGVGDDLNFDANADLQLPLFPLGQSSSIMYEAFGSSIYVVDYDPGGRDTEVGASFAAGVTNIRMGSAFFL
jgi:hypothetical protein